MTMRLRIPVDMDIVRMVEGNGLKVHKVYLEALRKTVDEMDYVEFDNQFILTFQKYFYKVLLDKLKEKKLMLGYEIWNLEEKIAKIRKSLQ